MFIEWSDVVLPSNAKKFVKNCMHLLASFSDTEIPPTSSWGRPLNGGAALLNERREEISDLVIKMVNGEANVGPTLRGWTQYTAAAIALSAFFSHHNMDKAIDVCLASGKAENDELQRGLCARETDLAKATSQPEPKLEETERRDIGGEKKYEQMKAYVAAVDVFKIVTGMVSTITEAVMYTLEEEELRKPRVSGAREKLLDVKQAWRVSKEEARERERLLRAKEVVAESEDFWGFAPVREG